MRATCVGMANVFSQTEPRVKSIERLPLYDAAQTKDEFR